MILLKEHKSHYVKIGESIYYWHLLSMKTCGLNRLGAKIMRLDAFDDRINKICEANGILLRSHAYYLVRSEFLKLINKCYHVYFETIEGLQYVCFGKKQ